MARMLKTTVYLTSDLKTRLERVAATKGVSEADVIRTALEEYTEREPPRPRTPLFSSGRGDIAHRVDEILAEGFGRD